MYVKTLITDIDSNAPKVKIGAYYYDYGESSDFLSNEYLNASKFVLITDDIGIMNGARYGENELLINIESYVRVAIDDLGCLNITDFNAENVYEINDMGELIYKIFE